jgi:heat-inducible transcriptional repressor
LTRQLAAVRFESLALSHSKCQFKGVKGMPVQRQRQILKIIVDEYIHNPVPVSSVSVARRMPVPVSSATIRKETADLKEKGYITRPHTSAGSMPSDKGYREYVTDMEEIPDPPKRVREAVRGRFSRTGLDIEARSRMAVELLASLVHSVAVLTLPRAVEARWKRIELVYLQEFLVLLVVVMQQSRVRQQLLSVMEPMTQDSLNLVSNKLNAGFSGLSHHKVGVGDAGLTSFELEVRDTTLGLLRAEEEESFPVHYLDGLRHLFGYPELSGGSRARELVELLEDRVLVPSVFTKAPATGTVGITIGTEHESYLLHPFSVVYASYGTPLGETGVVGMIGPTRLQYATVISNVRYVSSVMTEMTTGLHTSA